MGEQNVSIDADAGRQRDFMRALLADVWALEKMLETGRIESGVCRIGAEQEMFLVHHDMRPAPIAAKILPDLDERFTTELGKFNLEANLSPRLFENDCLRSLEREITEIFSKAREAADKQEAEVVLTGILPTISLSDLTLENMTEIPRYFELNRTLSRLRKSKFYVHIKGLDEVHITHDNMMLEACNTSFQVHLQVEPTEFVDMYNLAQAICAPVLAVAVNSPLLLGQRLWSETRLPLLQHSVDERSEVLQARYRAPRVSFGERWLQKSIVEIFRQDIARFRVILTHAIDEHPEAILDRGDVPRLSALRLHNGTIWRWNRPCYGILDGKPHLRIENRVFPSGPSIPDEVANAAFFLGLMTAMKEEYVPVDRLMEFDQAQANFYAAARHGLNAQFQWMKGTSYPAVDLVLNHLIALSRAGLKARNVVSEDIDRYIGIIEERVKSRQTGAQWMVRSLASMFDQGTPEMRLRVLTKGIMKRQQQNEPVHHWPLISQQEIDETRQDFGTVGQIMSTKLFTVHPEDIVDYVASIMHWEHLRHIPVEDHEHRLVGLVSSRNLLQLLAQGSALNRAQGVPVEAIMKRDVITVTPETPTLEAIQLMRQRRIGALPVLKDGRLVGILTLFDLVTVSARLLEESLQKKK